ncbi:MAG: ABC transporter ATP-binding protein [Proteobacteria bacterium]|nr:ABC transporter ATP-binding protein [Pseudomonadota bacterium]MCP4920269.1 ABC transporter ATP-binding protein [Pseudomonadota bacterium]
MSLRLRRLLSWYRPYTGRLVFAAVLMAVAAAIPAALVILIEQVLDRVLIEHDEVALAVLPFAVAGLYIANGAIGVGRAMITKSVAFRVVTRLRRALFEKLLVLEPSWHQKVPLGDRLTWLTQDVGQVQYLVSAWATLVQKPLTLLGLVATIVWMDWRLAALALVALPVVAWPIAAFGRRLRRSAREALDNLADLTGTSQESLTGIRTVQAFRAEDQVLGRFDDDNELQYRLILRRTLAQLLPGPVIELVAAIGVGLVLAWGGRQVFAGALQGGELIAFLVALGLMNQPLKSLSEIVSLTQRALAGADRVFDVLDQPAAVQDGTVELDTDACRLEFDRVAFDYGDGPVLTDVGFTVEPGQTVALVGASGAGKSTLAGLVPRFHDVTGGELRLNGLSIADYTLSSLRRHVAVVAQEPFLFDTTVLENVRLGRPSATRDEVVEACRQARAHDFIGALPKGYDTRLEEAGLRLSGGQRQRICIARALLVDAPILVLDEATSALDRENEEAVQEALDALRAGRTTIAIAHRLSTIRDADVILVLVDGRVVEAGRHDDLLLVDGEYARLYGAP